MATARDIIVQALMQLTVFAPSETPDDASMEQGLTSLNDMLDQWSNENLACYATIEQSGTLLPGVAQYSIGPGGTFNMTRPLRLVGGAGSAYTQDTSGNNYLMDVIEQDQWNLIGNRSSIMQSNFPTVVFYDPQYPLGLLNFWPQPNQGIVAFWDSYLQLTDFANMTSPVNLPPGYKKALQDNLAVELWPFFKSGDVSQTTLIRAMISKGNVKRTNIKFVKSLMDPELVARSNATYNVYQDSFSRTNG